MHIISDDRCSKELKTKEHYNSFHPSLGFFLHIDDLLSQLAEEPVNVKPDIYEVSGSRLCLPLYWEAWWLRSNGSNAVR